MYVAAEAGSAAAANTAANASVPTPAVMVFLVELFMVPLRCFLMGVATPGRARSEFDPCGRLVDRSAEPCTANSDMQVSPWQRSPHRTPGTTPGAASNRADSGFRRNPPSTAGDVTVPGRPPAFSGSTTAIAAIVSLSVWALLGCRGRLCESMAGAPPY
ncbi:hypothetical protein GCM10020229_62750 [Kitasatospora albolonga]